MSHAIGHFSLREYMDRAQSEPTNPPPAPSTAACLREYMDRAQSEPTSSSPARETGYSWLLDDEKFIGAVAERVRQRV